MSEEPVIDIEKLFEQSVKSVTKYYGDLAGKEVFLPYMLGNEILNEHHIATAKDTEQIYVYQSGVYVNGGDKIIKYLCDFKTGQEISSGRVNEVLFHVRCKTYKEREEFNASKNCIVLENGVYDLERKHCFPHDPSYLATIKLPVYYDKKADCPKIKQFLSEILNEPDIPIVQEIIGYCLINELPIQKAFMFVGEGANGKSTLLNLVKALLGSKNTISITLQDLTTSRFAAGLLYGKLANLYADLPDVAIKEVGKFKVLTGGDQVTADQKYTDPLTFTNTAKLLFSCNKLPRALDDTDAFFRRWVPITFPNRFDESVANTNLIDELTTQEELSGLFNFALEGLERLLNNGKFSNSKSIDVVRDFYERMSDPFNAFTKDCVESDPNSDIEKGEFYQAYIVYCLKERLPTTSRKTFDSKIKQFLPEAQSTRPRKRGKQIHAWGGIKLSENFVTHYTSKKADSTDSLNIYSEKCVVGEPDKSNESASGVFYPLANLDSKIEEVKYKKGREGPFSDSRDSNHIYIQSESANSKEDLKLRNLLSKAILQLCSQSEGLELQELCSKFVHYAEKIDVDRLIKEMMKQGQLFEPRQGIIKSVGGSDENVEC